MPCLVAILWLGLGKLDKRDKPQWYHVEHDAQYAFRAHRKQLVTCCAVVPTEAEMMTNN